MKRLILSGCLLIGLLLGCKEHVHHDTEFERDLALVPASLSAVR